MRFNLSLVAATALAASILCPSPASAQAAHPKAVFHTNQGDFTVELYPDKAPKTVANFIGLAKGTKDWTDPRSHAKVTGKPLYDGTTFHRIIKGFMIQGGDPEGTGRGGPGYSFEDEFSPDLRFDQPGLLAMANAGPGTNGSQFFVTTSAPAHLNNHHTIFGKVISGYDVVQKIEGVPTGPGDRPQAPVVIKHIDIVEAAPAPAAAAKADAKPAAPAATAKK